MSRLGVGGSGVGEITNVVDAAWVSALAFRVGVESSTFPLFPESGYSMAAVSPRQRGWGPA